MKSCQPLLFLLPLVALLSGTALRAAPVVSNVVVSQRAGTKLVDIVYDLEAPAFPTVEVTLEASSDGGATWTVPVAAASGAVGPAVAPGTGKAIVWNAGADWPEGYSSRMRIRVTADDGVPEVFALIPAGSFTMGRTSGDADTDAPPTVVTVGAFYLAETETTWALWKKVRTWALANGYTDLTAGAGKGANHPVHSVNWWDVVRWCNARSEMEGLTPVYTVDGEVVKTGTRMRVPDVNWSASGYRLPTEAEWEKAARGGESGKRYPWGTDTISHAQANYNAKGTGSGNQSGNAGYHSTYNDGTASCTSPVGSFDANEYGLKDMAGNVWEWCWDWFEFNYYGTETTDPKGPASGFYRVRRGGSWLGYATLARCASRYYDSPAYADRSIGFRSARSSVP